MEKYEAWQFDTDKIVLKREEDLDKILKLLENNTDFIITFTEKLEGKSNRVSRIIIASEFFPHVKQGTIRLWSRSDGEQL